MIDRFVRALTLANVDVDSVAVAEMLWLVGVVGPVEGAEPAPAGRGGMLQNRGGTTALNVGARNLAAPQRRAQVTPAPNAGPNPRVGVYVDTGHAQGAQAERASRVRVPRVAALPATMEIGRALRPFGRRKPSAARFVVDAERTAELAADTGVLSPVLVPARERWFDVALVVDESPSMAVWRDTAAEFAHLLGQHGAFRDVRRWSLRSEGQHVSIVSESGLTHHWRELIDPSGRRLVMVLSDCVGGEWFRPATWGAIAAWGESTPTVLVQLLPERLWRSSALESASLTVSASRPALTNAELDIEVPWWAQPQRARATPLPVVSLEPTALGAWAHMLMGGSARIAATSTAAAEHDDAPAPLADVTAQDRIRAFHELVSPTAYRLAIYLSAVPLTLPVMRLVQQTMLPQSTQSHLAEFFLGGLISVREATATGGVTYDFYPGVRECLQGSVLRSEALRVLDAISAYVEANLGSPLDFRALIADEYGRQQLPDGAMPFAAIGASLLARVGHIVPSRRADSGTASDAERRPGATLQSAAPAFGIRRPLVLVAGTALELHPEIERFVAILGRRLAEAGYDVQAGPEPGVDTTVARNFRATAASEANAGRLNAYDYDSAKTPGGLRILTNALWPFSRAESNESDWPSGADAAIFIGGGRATERGVDILRKRGCAVLPLAGTGGAASRASAALLRMERSARLIDETLLRLVATPIKDRPLREALASAEPLADDVISVLDVLTNEAARGAYHAFFSIVADSLTAFLVKFGAPGPRDFAAFAREVMAIETSIDRTELGSTGRWFAYTFGRLESLRSGWPQASEIQADLVERIKSVSSSETLEAIVAGAVAGRTASEIRALFAALDGLALPSETSAVLKSVSERVFTVAPISENPEPDERSATEEASSLPALSLASVLRDKPGNTRRIAWSPDGRLLAVAGYDGIVRIWDPERALVVRALLGGGQVLYSVSWSPDGQSLAAGGADGILFVWDVPTSRLMLAYNFDTTSRRKALLSVAFSPDGNSIAAGSDNGFVFVWSRENGTSRRGGHDGACHAVAWSPDGTRIASCSNDRTIHIWSPEADAPIVLRGHTGEVYGIAWSPVQPLLVSGSADRTVRVWDVPGVTLLKTLEGHRGAITDIALAPDGSGIASISWDDTIGLWELATGRLALTLPADSARRFHAGVAFRPQLGTGLAFTAKGASEIQIWGDSAWNPGRRPALAMPEIDEAVGLLGNNPSAILDTALQVVVGFTRSGYVQIFLARGGLEVARRINDGESANYSVAASGGLVATAFSSGNAIWATDVRRESAYVSGRAATRSELVLPMSGVGVINIEFDEVSALSPIECDWLAAFASALGLRLRETSLDPDREILPFIPTLDVADKRSIEDL